MRSLGAKKENFGMQIVWLNAREIWEEDLVYNRTRFVSFILVMAKTFNARYLVVFLSKRRTLTRLANSFCDINPN